MPFLIWFYILKLCLLPAYQTVSLFEWLSEDYVPSYKIFHVWFFSAIIKHWSTSCVSLMRFSTNAFQCVNYTFQIHSVDLNKMFQQLFIIVYEGFSELLWHFLLWRWLCWKDVKFSWDVSYKLFILAVSVFIAFHNLTNNFYKNCISMLTIM